MADNLYTSYSSPDTIGDMLTTTANAVSKDIKDNYFNKYVLLDWFNRKASEKVDGGAHIIERLEYDEIGNVGFVNANDVLDSNMNQLATEAIFKGKIAAGTISITDDELSENSGKASLTSLITLRENNLRKSMARVMAQALWSSAPANNAPNSLLEILSASDPARGALGNIARATYSFWQAKVETSVGSFAAAGLNSVGSFLRLIAPNQGMEEPELAATTAAIFGYFENSLFNRVRLADEDMVSAGFKNIKYNNTVVTYDEFCPAGYIAYLHSEYIKMKTYKTLDFKVSPYLFLPREMKRTRQLITKYNIVPNQCRKLGLQSGITA